MKNVILTTLCMCYCVATAQEKKPFAFTYAVELGSNFSDMNTASVNTVFGYDFTENFSAGVSVPMYVMLFKSEGEKQLSFSGGLGINASFATYKNNKIELKTSLDFSIDENSTDDKDWIFIKYSLLEQIFIKKLCTKDVKPFVGIGFRQFRGFVTGYEDKSFRIHNFYTPFIQFGAVVNY